MLRVYVIGIVVGSVIHLSMKVKRNLPSSGRHASAGSRGVLVDGRLVVHALACALAGLFWPCLVLQGAAHVLMVMAVRINAYRAAKVLESGAVLHSIEPESETRKAA